MSNLDKLNVPKYAQVLRDKRGVGIDARLGPYYEVRVLDSAQRVIWSSGRVRFHELPRVIRVARVVSGRALRVYLCLFSYLTSVQSVSCVLVPWSFRTYGGRPQKGQLPSGIEIHVTAYARTYRELSNKLRVRSAAHVKRARLARASSTNGAPRGSPEVVTKPMETFRYVIGGGPFFDPVFNMETYFRSWTGARTPNFGAKRRAGILPVNDHSVVIRQTSGGASFKHVKSIHPTDMHDDVEYTYVAKHYAIPGVSGHLPRAHDLALERLVDESGQALDGNLAQDLAQFHQTTGMMTNTLGRLTGAINGLRKHDFGLAFEHLWAGGKPVLRRKGSVSPTKSLASNWLECQYGWKPLLQDIRASLMSLSAYFSADSTFVSSVRTSGRAVNKSITAFGDVDCVGPVGTWDVTTRTSSRIVIRFRVSDAAKAFLAQTGFTNPLNLAWEVLPFSFVVDWFTPIGPWLSSFSSFDGLTFLSGCETLFTRENLEGVIAYNGAYAAVPGDGRYTCRVGGDISRESIILNRSRLNTWPGRNNPVPKNPFSTTHVLNGLALLRGAFH